MMCGNCNSTKKLWASCGSRYCNRCGSHRNAEWLEKRMVDMLPIPHYMVTLTIPEHLRNIFYHNQKLCYGLMFSESIQALKDALKTEWGEHVQTGFAAFLHTWAQNLSYHPHVHILVPAGGLSDDEMEWIMPERKDWLCNFRIISSLFKGKLCDALLNAFEKGKLTWPKNQKEPGNREVCRRFLLGQKKIHWRVDISLPQGGPTGAFDYLARYVFRSAIGNNRILDANKDHVDIAVKDRETHQMKKVKLTTGEFLKRIAYHILPKGFTRVRWYGFLACAKRKLKTSIIRGILQNTQLAISEKGFLKMKKSLRERLASKLCQHCKKVKMTFHHFTSGLQVRARGHSALSARYHGKVHLPVAPS